MTKDFQRILSFTRRAVEDYRMIEAGDSIAVGISGGKDSLTLLLALAEMRRFLPVRYSLTALTVDPGFPGADYGEIEELCRRVEVPYQVVPSDIAKIVFDLRKEPNPCSLCSKLRRGMLHSSAKALGCNKIALGHHFDDAVDTFMMNLFFEGRLGCFSPVTYLSRSDITLIRPLLYTQEKEIRHFVARNPLPVMESLCPENRQTERENIKLLLADLEKKNKGLRHRIFGAMCRGNIDGFFLNGKLPE